MNARWLLRKIFFPCAIPAALLSACFYRGAFDLRSYLMYFLGITGYLLLIVLPFTYIHPFATAHPRFNRICNIMLAAICAAVLTNTYALICHILFD